MLSAVDRIRGFDFAKPPKVETAGQVAKVDKPLFGETAGSVASTGTCGGSCGGSLNVIA